MKNFKVCMLTTGFPRFQGDLFGTFVQELAQELARGGEMAVEVLAPHAAGLPTSERFGSVEVRRFRYFWPAARQAVAYGGGIPSNIRSSWIARLQVPFFLCGFFLRAFARVRKGQVVHCHWTITGLVAYCATRIWRRPLVLSVRGSDINLLEKGLLARLHQLIYGWMDVVVAVSEDIAEKLALVGVPQGKIKDVLETQILPRFTSCFAQLTEGVAPNGNSMDSWLQDLTAEMQASIEKHLSKVFREEG